MKIEDYGLILLLFVIGGQIINSFLVVRIPIQLSGSALPNQIYRVIADSALTLNASSIQNASVKTWHMVETWIVSLLPIATVGSFNYLIFLKAEDRSDVDIIKEKDVERLNAKLRKWGHKMRRILSQISQILYGITSLT